MKCHKCGAENSAGSNFCTRCHSALGIYAVKSDKFNIDELELEAIEEAGKETEAQSCPACKKAGIFSAVGIIVVGLAATIGMPLYNDYVKSEKIRQAVTEARAAVENYTRQHQQWPLNSQQANYAGYQGQEMKVIINNGVIRLTLAENPSSATLFVPRLNERGYFMWKCEPGGNELKYLPTLCEIDNIR